MKYVLWGALILALGWAITGQLGASRARAQAETADSLIGVFRDSLLLERTMRERDRKDREQADSAAAVETERLTVTLVGMRDSLTRLGRDADAAFTALPDSVKPLVEIFRAETRACRAALELADTLHGLCSARVAARDSTIRDLDLSLAEADSLGHALEASVDRWRRIASPGLLERIRRNLPLVGGTVVLLLGVLAAIGLL